MGVMEAGRRHHREEARLAHFHQLQGAPDRAEEWASLVSSMFGSLVKGQSGRILAQFRRGSVKQQTAEADGAGWQPGYLARPDHIV